MPDSEGEGTALPYLAGTSVCVTLTLHTVGKRGNGRLLKCSNAAKRSLHVSHCSLPPQSRSLEVGGVGNMPSRNMGAGPRPPTLEKPFPAHSQGNSSHWKASAQPQCRETLVAGMSPSFLCAHPSTYSSGLCTPLTRRAHKQCQASQ